MRRNSSDYFTGHYVRRIRSQESSSGKLNTLLSDLLNKEEEVKAYKEKLEQLESAFYYNLEIISERDLELEILEKQLRSENSQIQDLLQEKNHLENLLKTIDDKHYRKIKQLETKLTLKDEEIMELKRENISNATHYRKSIQNIKDEQQKEILKINNKFDNQKNEIIKNCREEMEGKENYYLQEIDAIAGKFEEVLKEKKDLFEIEEENKALKCQMLEIERIYLEKENYYLQEISKITINNKKKANKDVQCDMKIQTESIRIQATPCQNTVFSQTTTPEKLFDEESYIEKINFLQQQNEVLKCVIKDLKKNRDVETNEKVKTDKRETGCGDCSGVKSEVEKINEKFENEIENLKKILLKEQKQRAQEEVIMQSLETSVTCLKNKLITEIQDNFHQLSDNETYNPALHEIQILLLEEKLSKKIDDFTTTAEEERIKLNEKLVQLKTECIQQMQMLLQQKQESTEVRSEDLLEKIRLEIHKLENKIQGDMKNILRNNLESDKCDKNFQTSVRNPEKREVSIKHKEVRLKEPPKVYYNNDFVAEKCISVKKVGKFQNEYQKRRYNLQKGLNTPNELLLAR